MVPAVIIGGIPSGVFMYWITANTLRYKLVLKIPGSRRPGIPDMAKITADQLPLPGIQQQGSTRQSRHL